MITTEVAVIGLGAMGAATLYQLARRGERVLGIDQYAPPHALGSTHGETRITRLAVGEGEAYVPLVMRSHEIWRKLEKATGTELMVSCGAVMMGRMRPTSFKSPKPDFLFRTMKLAKQFGIRHELLSSDELVRCFPQFGPLEADEMAYYEPEGGFVNPEACVSAQLAEALRFGANIKMNTKVKSVTQHGETVRIATDTDQIEAGRAVVAAGPWTASLVREPFVEKLRVTREVMHWFAAADPALFVPERCPVFIRMWGDVDYFYGFPTPKGSFGVKVAIEEYGNAVDPNSVNRNVAEDEAFNVYDTHIAGRLPGVKREHLRSLACLYTKETNGNFLIDTHPAMARVMVVSACSGHGFKHSAAIGQAVAHEVSNGRTPVDPHPSDLMPVTLSPFRV